EPRTTHYEIFRVRFENCAEALNILAGTPGRLSSLPGRSRLRCSPCAPNVPRSPQRPELSRVPTWPLVVDPCPAFCLQRRDASGRWRRGTPHNREVGCGSVLRVRHELDLIWAASPGGAVPVQPDVDV